MAIVKGFFGYISDKSCRICTQKIPKVLEIWKKNWEFLQNMRGVLRKKTVNNPTVNPIVIQKDILIDIVNNPAISLELKTRLALSSKTLFKVLLPMLKQCWKKQCSYCQTTNRLLNDVALLNAGGYQLHICYDCYYKNEREYIIETPWVQIVAKDYGHCLGEHISLRSQTNHKKYVIEWHKRIVLQELMGNGYVFNPVHMAQFEKIATRISYMLFEILSTTNDTNVKRIIEIAAPFVSAFSLY